MRRLFVAGLVLALAGLTLVAGMVGGVVLDRSVLHRFVPTGDIPAGAESGFKLMAEAWNAIDKSYVDREAVVTETLTYGAVSGMVDALGDTGHSRFLSPQMVAEQASFTSGEFEGIGAYVEMRDGRVVVVAPIDGSPAQDAGVRPGDIIAKVDGEDVAGLSLDQVVAKILGPAGTQVTVTLTDPDTGQSRDLTLTRARIKLDNVTWARLPGTDLAEVRMVAFSDGVTKDLEKSLREIQQAGLKGIVLDLRNNPGGLLSEAIGTASQFLRSGNVLQEKDASGEITDVPVKEGGAAPDLPMVVLINQGTASASEIVSGALQDAGRAKLVGETTFGTGTVLNQFPLSGGAALLLATQEWLTPSGRVIWHKGIEPDVAVELPETGRALVPEQAEALTAEELKASSDAQLLEAIGLLNGGPVPPAEPATVVTLDSDGETIRLRTGDRFLLKLGEEYDWTVEVADPDVVSRVIGITVVRGAQGVFEAHQAGTTSLTATGDPPCRKSQPPCGMPSRMFQIQIVAE